MLRIKTLAHNHSSTLQELHLSLRKLFVLTLEMREQIVIQIAIETSSLQILINLRVNENEDNSLFKTRDIYNQR
jgi:hypothetical protein